MTALFELTASEAASRLRRGDVSAEDYARAHLDRCARFGHLNAFLDLHRDAVLEAAHSADRARAAGRKPGRLHGLLLAVKDNIDVAGAPTSCNTPAFAGHRARADAAIVARLKDEGAIVLGKASMHELALGSPNGPRVGGDPVNPHAPGAMTGGSSSGTAVAVAARLASAGLGTDTGGSVRIPAAHCGIAGLRPTLGHYSGDGIVVLCPTRDTAGPMARTIADAALIDAAITGEDGSLPAVSLAGLRIGMPRRYFREDLHPDTASFLAQEVARLAAHGAVLVEADIDDVARLNDAISMVVFLYEVQRQLRRAIAERKPGLAPERFAAEVRSPGCRDLVAGMLGADGRGFTPVPDEAYHAAIEVHRPALRAAYRRYFGTYRVDAIVYPTTPLPAGSAQRKIAGTGAGVAPLTLSYIRLIDPSSNAGLPGISVPAGRTQDGIPLGLAFDGPEGSDRRLLAIGAAYERAVGPFPAPALAP